MGDTYDPTLPTDKDKVRLLLSDNHPPTDKFSDEEILAMLSMAGGVYSASANLADSLAAQYSASVNIVVDGLSVSNSDKSKAYRDLAARLRAQGPLAEAGGLGVPTVGGVSISDVDSVNRDADRTPSQFSVGMMDFPPASVVFPNRNQ